MKVQIGSRYYETLNRILNAVSVDPSIAEVDLEKRPASCYRCVKPIEEAPIRIRLENLEGYFDYHFHRSCLGALLQERELKRISMLN